jgi:hypothetical protein
MATDPTPDRRPRRPDLDEIFGEVLPDTTSDEREPGAADRDPDDWYQRNRPPHHDQDGLP